MTIRISRAALEAVVRHARREQPNECCGLLIGTEAEIEEARPARNLRPGPTRFLIDPQDHFKALREARASGRLVRGAYHSHPHGPPTPSATDVAEAHDPALVHLIVSLEDDGPVVRAYAIDAGYTSIDLVTA